MCNQTECGKCDYNENLRGCATKHVEKARTLLAEGKVKGADRQLSYIERHLKEE